MIADALYTLIEKDPTVKRHLVKTVSWRLVGSLDTFFLGWFVTGQMGIGAKISAIELVTKMVLYFAHERMWHKIHFGIPTRSTKAQQVKNENAGNLFAQDSKVSRVQREKLNEHRAFTIWLTGLSASGKSTIAGELDKWFFSSGMRSYVIDGDNTRLGINSDLSFSKEDRKENIRRVAELCKLMNDAGAIVIASFISPFAIDRAMAKNIIGANDFTEVFVDASVATCKARDIKGLYALAESGKIKDFTGISSPYERPEMPDVHLRTDNMNANDCAYLVTDFLKQKGTLFTVQAAEM